MFSRVKRSSARSIVWIASFLVVLSASAAHAQTKPEDTSLQFVPADAGFYVTMLRGNEQWQIVRNSKAYARLEQNFLVQMALVEARKQWENPSDPNLAMFKALLEKPENKQLLALLHEAAGEEVFFYGDSGFAKQIALINRINNVQQIAALESAASGQPPSNEEIGKRMVQAVIENADQIEVPIFTVGAKIKDKNAAAAQLKRLEDHLKEFAAAKAPQLVDRLKRTKVGQDDYLVLSLDGSMVPWDKMRQEMTGAEEQVDQLKEKLSQKTLSVAVGTHGPYIILSVGPSTDHLAKLGTGEKLTGRKEFAQLKKHLDKRVTSIGYASGDFLEQLSSIDQQLDAMSNMVRAALPLAKLDQNSQQKILSTVDDVIKTAKTQLPRPGTMLAVSYLTDRGFEGYSYDWSQNSPWDSSKTLSILNHVGGRPLLMVAGRTKYRPEQYEDAVRLAKRIYEVGNEIAMQKLQPEEKEVYQKLRDKLLPLAHRLDRANREMLIPAFKDSQSALVIDADLTTKQLQNMMPMSNVDLPVPEIAIVSGVSDAELLKKGARELFDIAQQVINAVREVAPEDVPPIQLPSPQIAEDAGGNIYSYPLPQEWQLDEQLAPNAGLSKDTLVLSNSPATTRRLLQSTPVFNEGVLGDSKKPLAAAGFLDFAQGVDTVTPWIRYGIAINQNSDVESVVLPFQDIIDVLKCFQYFSSVTYQENDIWVTHSESHFRDLEQ